MKTLTVTNPWDNQVLAELELTSEEELKKIVDKSKAAQKEWAATSLYDRAQILYKFADIWEENEEDLIITSSKDMGKPYQMSKDEVSKIPQNIRGTIEYAMHMYGQVTSHSN